MSKHDWLDSLRAETAVNAYIDLANVFNWQRTLKWNFLIEDLIRNVFSLPSIREVKVYYGTDTKDPGKSEALHKRILKIGATLKTKPVKYIRKTVNENFFVRQSTLKLFDPETTTLVQSIVSAVRKSGIEIEEPKCNFDVEMTMDMIDDLDRMTGALLFSGDSDFFAPLERLRIKGKRIYIVGVRGQVASELYRVSDYFIDFGKIYTGSKRRLLRENPAFRQDRVNGSDGALRI